MGSNDSGSSRNTTIVTIGLILATISVAAYATVSLMGAPRPSVSQVTPLVQGTPAATPVPRISFGRGGYIKPMGTATPAQFFR